jgi:hypothetical protein
MTMLRRFSVLLAFALAAAGCGGGSGTTPGGPAPGPTTAPRPPVETASVTFSIAVPSRVMSLQRQPRYVSPATATVQITVNGGVPQSFPVSGGAPCSSTAQPPASGTCIVASVQAPAGDDTFTVRLLDASGHTLSGGTVQQTIIANQTNTVNITFDGVVAALRVSLTKPTPPTGATTRLGVFLSPLDAAGYSILGAPGALPNVTLTDGDTSGASSLYLPGNDGNCGPPPPGPTPAPVASVVVTSKTVLGLSFYGNACLLYHGQPLPNGATITASIPSGPSGTTTLMPSSQTSASGGVWVLGLDSNSSGQFYALEHFSPSLAVLATVSGANTHVTGGWGLAVDAASGNIVLGSDLNFVPNSPGDTEGTWDGYLYTFPPSASGNAAPSSSTHFTGIPVHTGHNPDYLQYVALDGAGNAFVLQLNGPFGKCVIWRVPLTGGTVPAVKADDCGNLTRPVQNHFGNPFGLVIDRGYLYAGVPALVAFVDGAQVIRYTIGSGGTLTRNAVLALPNANASSVGVDAAGNLLMSPTSWGSPPSSLGRFAAANFVSGQTTTAYLNPADVYQLEPPAVQDAAGNIYANAGGLAVSPADGHAVASAHFTVLYIALAKPN